MYFSPDSQLLWGCLWQATPHHNRSQIHGFVKNGSDVCCITTSCCGWEQYEICSSNFPNNTNYEWIVSGISSYWWCRESMRYWLHQILDDGRATCDVLQVMLFNDLKVVVNLWQVGLEEYTEESESNGATVHFCFRGTLLPPWKRGRPKTP